MFTSQIELKIQRLRKLCYAGKIRKTTKNHPLDVAKKYVETYPHLIQQHETPRKGHSTINLHKLIKSRT